MAVLDHTYRGMGYPYNLVDATVKWSFPEWIVGAFAVKPVQGLSNLWIMSNGEGDWWVVQDRPTKIDL